MDQQVSWESGDCGPCGEGQWWRTDRAMPALQAEGAAGTKALRLECSCGVQACGGLVSLGLQSPEVGALGAEGLGECTKLRCTCPMKRHEVGWGEGWPWVGDGWIGCLLGGGTERTCCQVDLGWGGS